MVQGTTRVERTATDAAIAVIAGFIRSQPSARASSALLDWAARDCRRQLATDGHGSVRTSRDAPFPGLEGIDSKFRLIRCRLSLTGGRAYTIGRRFAEGPGQFRTTEIGVSTNREPPTISGAIVRGTLLPPGIQSGRNPVRGLGRASLGTAGRGARLVALFTQNRRALIADRAGCYAVEPSGAVGRATVAKAL